MHTLTPTPLTKHDFAPFGEIIELNGNDSIEINSGNCQRFSDLATIDISRSGTTGISLFDANAYESPLPLTYVERHPLGSQAFLPTSLDPYLVIVAEDENGAPKPPLVFYTDGFQGVNYHRNTWHGVLTPIVKRSLFAVVDYIGDENNLEEYVFPIPYVIDFTLLTNTTTYVLRNMATRNKLDPKRLPQRVGEVPPQSTLMDRRAIVTDAYTVIPRGSMTDIVNSRLPFWNDTLVWVLASPVGGFCQTFSHYLVETEPGGGSETPETEEGVQATIFVTAGSLTLTVDGNSHLLECGSYVYLPPGCEWSLFNTGAVQASFHWFRKPYRYVKGLDEPDIIVTQESDIDAYVMPGSNDGWSTKRFVDKTDLRHDMHITIVSFEPGCVIPFLETHVMEHGLYVLEGKGVYNLNQDWVEVEAGDYMWLRAYCPQACYAGGDGTFRYLLYKDVNRHMAFPRQ